jgi:hypothetical protein
VNSRHPILDRLPEARTESIADLLVLARTGRVRVPAFQRGLRWKSADVLLLFDSVRSGLPIGSLLFWTRPAKAERLTFGPVEVAAERFEEAWWVIDGQQRLTSLAAALLRSLPLPGRPSRIDPFVVYFDPVHSAFRGPPTKGDIPPEWVPLPALLDASYLSEWIYDWPAAKNSDLRKAVFDAGKRIREYKIPLYLVSTSDEAVLREIFSRVNNTGKPLGWEDVYDALYGKQGRVPSSTMQVAERLAHLKMGVIERGTIVNCIVGMLGLDVTRPLRAHTAANPKLLRGATPDVYQALQQTFLFLRKHASIPHLRFLPSTFALPVLARFFRLHPSPSARATELLSRWLWRTFLGTGLTDERTLVRRSINAIGNSDAEAGAQALLRLVAGAPREVEIPKTFDARSAGNRIVLVALASLRPRDPESEQEVDVAQLIEKNDVAAFHRIVSVADASKHSAGPENIALYCGKSSLLELLRGRVQRRGTDDVVLRSHAVDAEAAAALRGSKLAEFLRLRSAHLRRIVETFQRAATAWGRDRDRASIESILKGVE